MQHYDPVYDVYERGYVCVSLCTHTQVRKHKTGICIQLVTSGMLMKFRLQKKAVQGCIQYNSNLVKSDQKKNKICVYVYICLFVKLRRML